jgi:hypothetical protein
MQSVTGRHRGEHNPSDLGKKLDARLRTLGDARGSVVGFDSQMTNEAQQSHKGIGHKSM